MPRVSSKEISMEKHELIKLEAHVQTLKTAHAELGAPNGWDEFWRIIHQPGWTTIAEFILVQNTLESIGAQTRQLAALKTDLINGARAVNTNVRSAGA
jgi:hypothetical protein